VKGVDELKSQDELVSLGSDVVDVFGVAVVERLKKKICK
jgi:hypothetical protein